MIFCFKATAWAATNQAPSVALADVSATVNNSNPGDTVVIPPGTATWTAPFSFQGIHLIGSGTSQTIIIDGMDRNTFSQQPLIQILGSSTNAELSNFQILHGSTTLNWKGEIVCCASGPVRIHNLFLNQLAEKNIILQAANQTLVDHCAFLIPGIAVEVHDTGYGDAAWATPISYGSLNFPYVEDCCFTNSNADLSIATSVCDLETGGRVVFRHNTVVNSSLGNHGTETGGRLRGCRAFEIYSNTFTYDHAAWWPWSMLIRSGCGPVFGNTCNGQNYFVGIENYRDFQRFPPWGGADGFNSWDNVVATNIISGVHSGANGVPYVQVANANWAINQWVGYTVLNRDFYLTNYNLSIITSNSANCLYFHNTRDIGTMTFSNGQRFVVNMIYPMLDQPGRGSGDLVAGDMEPWGADPTNTITGRPTWPHQASDPIYFWNNTLNGTPATAASDYPNIQVGRDFFNDTPKPGYTPLVYPHPLQTLGGYSGGGSGLLLPPARIWIQ